MSASWRRLGVVVLLALLLASFCVAAEVKFTDMLVPLPGVQSGAVAWGDYDNDGDLDLLVVGAGGPPVTTLYRNDEGFLMPVNVGLRTINACAAAWGDYDGDGDLDLVIAGSVSNQLRVTTIYRNNGGTFRDIEAGVVGVDSGSVAWGDYDGDGDLDLAVAGAVDKKRTTLVTRIYRNDDETFTDIRADLPGLYSCSIAWADYDNDGDSDLAIMGYAANTTLLTALYRNDEGVLTDSKADLVPAGRGALAWADYDDDGDLDLAVAGYVKMGPRPKRATTIYNNHAGQLSDIGADIIGVNGGALAWGDYDGDGDLDLALAGDPGRQPGITRIYRNDETPFSTRRTFTEINPGILDIHEAALAWGDYDSDGDLDLVVAGLGFLGRLHDGIRCYESVTKLYRNDR